MGIKDLALMVSEVAADLAHDQIAFGDLAMAQENLKLIQACNTVAKVTEADYAKHAESIGKVYSMAVMWELIK